MNVKELIEELKKMNQKNKVILRVKTEDNYGDPQDFEGFLKEVRIYADDVGNSGVELYAPSEGYI